MPLPLRISNWPFLNIVEKQCKELGLDFLQVLAVIDTESSGKSFSERYEKDYVWIYKNQELSQKFKVSPDLLLRQQKTSFGLFQVMGSLALEMGMGFMYNYKKLPEELKFPEIGIYFGIRAWQKKFKKYGPNPLDVYAAYNAGSVRKINGVYVNQKHVNNYQNRYLSLGGQISQSPHA